MKTRIHLGLAAAIAALAIGIAFGTVASQGDNSLNINLEALSIVEINGVIQCHPINLLSGRLWINTVVCLNDAPFHCAYPHSTYVSDSTQDCYYLDY